jgi:hypothetical protein
VLHCIAFAVIPTVKVSYTFAVSGDVLLRYKESAWDSVNPVDVLKKLGLKSIPLKLGLGAVLLSAITIHDIYIPNHWDVVVAYNLRTPPGVIVAPAVPEVAPIINMVAEVAETVIEPVDVLRIVII